MTALTAARVATDPAVRISDPADLYRYLRGRLRQAESNAATCKHQPGVPKHLDAHARGQVYGYKESIRAVKGLLLAAGIDPATLDQE